MSNTPNQKHLYAALAAARAELQALPREGRYSYGSYMRAEDAIAIAREVLARHEIVLLVRDVGVSPVGDDVYLCTTTAELVHAPTGAAVTLTRAVPAVAQRGRPADKAALAAQTTTLGYLIRDVLLAPRREPYEIETLPEPTPEPAAPTPPAPAAPPPPPPPPAPVTPPPPPPATPAPPAPPAPPAAPAPSSGFMPVTPPAPTKRGGPIPPAVVALAKLVEEHYRSLRERGGEQHVAWALELARMAQGEEVVGERPNGEPVVHLRVLADHLETLRPRILSVAGVASQGAAS